MFDNKQHNNMATVLIDTTPGAGRSSCHTQISARLDILLITSTKHLTTLFCVYFSSPVDGCSCAEGKRAQKNGWDAGGGILGIMRRDSLIKLHALCIAQLSVIQLDISGCNLSGFAI